MTLANPPPQQVPVAFRKDREANSYFTRLNKAVFLLWQKTGGGSELDNLLLGSQSDVIAAQGDIPVGDAEGNAERLGLGADGQLVKSDGSNALWDWRGLVQVVDAPATAVATGTTTITLDDSIPQNSEGDQYLSASFTPKSADSLLVIDAIVALATSAVGNTHFIVALFEGVTASALASTAQFAAGAGLVNTVPLRHVMTAGTTSELTFKVRAGNNNAGTTTFNGVTSARILGGTCASRLTIREFAA